MKKKDVSIESLRKLGYAAMVTYPTWDGTRTKICPPGQSDELFRSIILAMNRGKELEFTRDPAHGIVTVRIAGSDRLVRDCFIARKMTPKELRAEREKTRIAI